MGGAGGRWQLVATGSALQDVIGAEKHASGGEVVVSPAAWKAIAGRCEGQPQSDAFVKLESIRHPPARALLPFPPQLKDTNVLRPFVPEAVLDRLLVPQAEWLAERRNVTVLLADLPTSAVDTPDDLQRTHQCIRAFQEIVIRYEGTIKVVVDDKGILLLAVFGLPPFAHETDAERAIQAGFALKAALAGLGVTCGIGIATGHGFCGAFGNDVRRDYMLRGDAINLAARLMKATHSEILCDQATTRAVRDRVAFEPLAPLTLKGKSEPVPVFRPIAGAVRKLADGQMVGRAAERALLTHEVEALRNGGAGRAIVVEGDAGLGKSRLMADVSATAQAVGLRVLTAFADPIEQSTSYAAWHSVFAEIFGIQSGEAAPREKIAVFMATMPAFERLAPLLDGVLRLNLTDNELTAEMSGDARAASTIRLLVAVLQKVAETGPTLLVVEDAHWLDASSWALLIETVKTVHPLLIVVATRPADEWSAPKYAELLKAVGDGKLTLSALSAEETTELVRARLQVEAVPESLARFVRDRVAGHPFFCEELLRAMRDRGSIQVKDGVCVVGDLTTLDLPTTVEGVILSRLDRLSPREQLCLKVASVIGRAFRQRTVRSIHPMSEERPRVPTHLKALAERGLIIAEAPEPEPGFLFGHALTRDVTYEMMPLVQRQPLHAAIAAWYEHNYADDLAPYYAVLAYHWARAADPARTVDYLEKAGHQALHTGAFQEAHSFFTQAIALAEDKSVPSDKTRRALWEKGLATASYYSGDMLKSRTHFEAAVAQLDRPVPASESEATRGVLGAALAQAMHRLLPSRYLGRRAKDKATLDEVVDCYTKLGQIYFLEGASQNAILYPTLRGLNVGEEAGPSPALARILTNVGVILGMLNLTKWSDWYADRATKMAEPAGNRSAAAYVRHLRTFTEAQRGRWAAALATNAASLALIQELGDYNLEAEPSSGTVTVYLHEGNMTEAAPALRRFRELADRNGNLQFLCVAQGNEIELLLAKDDLAKASQLLNAMLTMPTAPTDATAEIHKHRAAILTRRAEGRWAEAVAAGDAVFKMLEHQSLAYYWVDAGAIAVETYLAALERGGDYATANAQALRQRTKKSLATLKRLSRAFWHVRPRIWLLHGMSERIAGRHAAALTAYRKAAAIGRDMDMPFEIARAILEMTKIGGVTNDEVRSAVTVCKKLGATYLLAGLNVDAEVKEPRKRVVA
ncbi:MAG: AAA family ATPase [Alphaproteobacteria bacterium]|nr:AAA family ATPase [Alphaproteobacteria bacterium]